MLCFKKNLPDHFKAEAAAEYKLRGGHDEDEDGLDEEAEAEVGHKGYIFSVICIHTLANSVRVFNLVNT